MKILLLLFIISSNFLNAKEKISIPLNPQNIIDHFVEGESTFYLMSLELPIEVPNGHIQKYNVEKQIKLENVANSFKGDLEKCQPSDVVVLGASPIFLLIENRGRCISACVIDNEFVYVSSIIVANGMAISGEGGVTFPLPEFSRLVREHLVQR